MELAFRQYAHVIYIYVYIYLTTVLTVYVTALTLLHLVATWLSERCLLEPLKHLKTGVVLSGSRRITNSVFLGGP